MNNQRLGIADVGQQREQFQAVDQLLACLVAAARLSFFDSEGDDGAAAVGQVLLGTLVVGARFEPRIVDPLDAGMLGEVLGDGQRVGGVALQAQVQRLDPLQ